MNLGWCSRKFELTGHDRCLSNKHRESRYVFAKLDHELWITSPVWGSPKWRVAFFRRFIHSQDYHRGDECSHKIDWTNLIFKLFIRINEGDLPILDFVNVSITQFKVQTLITSVTKTPVDWLLITIDSRYTYKYIDNRRSYCPVYLGLLCSIVVTPEGAALW